MEDSWRRGIQKSGVLIRGRNNSTLGKKLEKRKVYDVKEKEGTIARLMSLCR